MKICLILHGGGGEKMKRLFLITAVLITISMLFSGCLSEKRKSLSQEEYRKYEFEIMGLSLNSDVKIIENIDMHDDFLEDGYTYSVYEFTNEQMDEITKEIKKSIYWSEFKKDYKIFLFDEYGETPPPKELTNGYIFLKERTQKTETKGEIESMKINGIQYGSYYYAVFDIESRKLYFCQFDS
jgi:hypothetical protein